MNPYVPPRPDAEPTVYPDDDAYEGPWIRVSQGILVFVGAAYLLLGLLAGGVYSGLPLLMMADDPDMVMMVPMGIVMFVCCGGVGLVNLVAAWGLGAHKFWAWMIALILGAMYLTSACMPFGALLLFGLVADEPTRKLFLK